MYDVYILIVFGFEKVDSNWFAKMVVSSEFANGKTATIKIARNSQNNRYMRRAHLMFLHGKL